MKIRFAEDGFDYVKSEKIELLDIAITQFCSFYKKCKTCYMGSTDTGSHGDLRFICTVIDSLSKMDCFEIALGGGSPNQHPEFNHIIYYSYVNNIVPNFTTFDDDWLADTSMVEHVKSYVGGIGVSVYSKNSLGKYNNIKEEVGKKCSVMVQHVVGMFPYTTTSALIEHVDHILLLGYKSTGRGSTQTPYKYTDEQIKSFFKYKNKKVSVDTAFLDNYGHILDDIGIPMELRSSPEGKFSCYIDAVEQRIGPSSYCNKDQMFRTDGSTQSIFEHYRKF